MFLYRLIYASRVSAGFNAKDIDQIVEASSRNNARCNITGALAFDRQYFLQCLEGHRVQINELYNRLMHDPRHTEVLLLDFSKIVRREFNDWMMPYAGSTAANSEIFFRYSSTNSFEPLSMSGEAAFGLLRELQMSQRETGMGKNGGNHD